jgi:hypothetical protein
MESKADIALQAYFLYPMYLYKAILQNKANCALTHAWLGFQRYFYVVKD